MTKSRRVNLGNAKTANRDAERSRAEVADRMTAEALAERQAKIGKVRRSGGLARDSDAEASEQEAAPDVGPTECAEAD